MIIYLFRRLFHFSLFFILVSIIIIITSTTVVNACVGVTSFYSENFPLQKEPGDIEETFYLLQNVLPGGEDTKVEIELVSGEEIVTLIDLESSYFIPYRGDVKIPLKIEIPSDAKPGEKYTISAVFRCSSVLGGGDVNFKTSITKSFPVVVSGVVKSPAVGNVGNVLFLVIFGFLAGLIIVVFSIIVYFVRQQRRTQIYGLSKNVAPSKF